MLACLIILCLKILIILINMLYSFKKYKIQYNIHVDFKHRPQSFLSLSRYCIIIRVSPFFRKMFIRSLLMYLNMLICNFFYSVDKNFFYFSSFMHILYSNYHPSIYYKYSYVM